jgi:predicted amidohydrolase
MRVTSIQLEIRDGTKEDAIAYALRKIDEAPHSDLLLLPEIWPSGYFSFDRYREDSESVDGPLVNLLKETAVSKKVHLLTGSFIERDGEELYNTSLLLDPDGKTLARYRKVHLFGYQSEERRLLAAGTEVVVADTPWGRVGLCTCYDLRFPEFFRKMLDRGVKFFLVASAWPYPRLEAWQLFNRARAHENLAYLFSCNCAGVNRGRQFLGHSMFVDPLGTVIAGGGDGPCFVSSEVDVSLVERTRKDFSALEDRVFR